MKKNIVWLFFVSLTFLLASCASIRYESFDTGIPISEEDPWSEDEVELRDNLWQDAKIVEDFDDGSIDPYFQEIINHSNKKIEDGILHVNRTDRDGIFSIYNTEGYKSIIFCIK